MDIRDLDRRAQDALIDTVSRLDVLDAPTPCPAWDVRALLSHLVAENRGFAGAGTWTDGDLGTDPAKAYEASASLVTSTFAAESFMDAPITVREFGTFPGKIAIRMHFIDTVAHGWDMARALNLPWHPDDDLIEAALATAERFPLTRGPEEAFGPLIELPSGASSADRFLAYVGRDPAWRP